MQPRGQGGAHPCLATHKLRANRHKLKLRRAVKVEKTRQGVFNGICVYGKSRVRERTLCELKSACDCLGSSVYGGGVY